MITLAISGIFLINVTRYLIKLPTSFGRSIFQSSGDNRFFRLRLLEPQPSLNARYPLTSLCNRSRFFPLNVEYDCLARLFLVLPATHGSRQFYNVSLAALQIPTVFCNGMLAREKETERYSRDRISG